jgi:splicing factor 45
MTGGAPPPKPGGGLSLYADLLGPPKDSASTSSSISRAPVVSQEALDAIKEQEASKKPVDPALRFQPFQSIRRPQQKSQKPKVGFPKTAAAPTANNSSVPAAAATTTPAPGAAPTGSDGGFAPQLARTTLADWAATEEDEWMYGTGEKRARGGRKNKRRKKPGNDDGAANRVETDWDEIYDPSRPTNVEEYLRSDERIREVRDWKALLYRHREPVAKRQSSWDSDEDDEAPRPQTSKEEFWTAAVRTMTLANMILNCHRPICSAAFLLVRSASSVAATSCSVARR